MRTSFVVPLFALLVACGGPAAQAPVPASPPGASSSAKAPGDAAVGDCTHCPVSGEAFIVRADSPHADYQGKTYYFCCPSCVKTFEADPAKYAGKPAI